MRYFSAILIFGMLALPVAAGIDFDLSARIGIGDNADLYVGISSNYYDRDPGEVRSWSDRYSNPDDLAVALFLSRHSGHSLAEIHALRHGGADWWSISIRYGVPHDVWFVPVAQNPGPPYGKAYGHHKKHKHQGAKAYHLSDGDLRNLVAVRTIHEYYGVPVATAMEWRSGGSNLSELMTNEYSKRHGKKNEKGEVHASTPHGHSKDGHPGKSNGKSGKKK